MSTAGTARRRDRRLAGLRIGGLIAASAAVLLVAGVLFLVLRQVDAVRRLDDATIVLRQVQQAATAVSRAGDLAGRALLTREQVAVEQAVAARDDARRALEVLGGARASRTTLRNAWAGFEAWDQAVMQPLQAGRPPGGLTVSSPGFTALSSATNALRDDIATVDIAVLAAQQDLEQAQLLLAPLGILALVATMAALVVWVMLDQLVLARVGAVAAALRAAARGDLGARADAGGWVDLAGPANEVIDDLRVASIAQEEKTAGLQRQLLGAESDRALGRTVLDNVPEAVLVLSVENTVLRVNRRVGEMFALQVQGTPPVATLRDHLGQVFGPEPDVVGACTGPGGDNRAIGRLSLVQQWPERREIELTAAPLLAGNNQVIGRLCVFADVTAERENVRVKTEFFSMVTHELRTPLTSINGYVDLLADPEIPDPGPERRAEFMRAIRRNTTRLQALTNDLLDLSALEAGKVTLDTTPVPVVDLLDGIRETFTPIAAEKEQSLTVRSTGALPDVQVDGQRIGQVLTNLVSNACKYTPKGGSVTVTAGLMPGGSQVWIAVQDTGYGLSPEERSRLFTRFYRAKNERTKGIPGTGLGLTITRQLVEMHGGTIAVDSEPGRGSTFQITVPVAPAYR